MPSLPGIVACPRHHSVQFSLSPATCGLFSGKSSNRPDHPHVLLTRVFGCRTNLRGLYGFGDWWLIFVNLRWLLILMKCRTNWRVDAAPAPSSLMLMSSTRNDTAADSLTWNWSNNVEGNIRNWKKPETRPILLCMLEWIRVDKDVWASKDTLENNEVWVLLKFKIKSSLLSDTTWKCMIWKKLFKLNNLERGNRFCFLCLSEGSSNMCLVSCLL